MMVWIIAAALGAAAIALLLSAPEGRQLTKAYLTLALALLRLAGIWIWIGIRLIPAVPAIAFVTAMAFIRAGKIHFENRREIKRQTRLESQARSIFGGFTLVETLPGRSKTELEPILRALFAIEFPETETLKGRRSRTSTVVIAPDPGDMKTLYGVVTTNKKAMKNARRNAMPVMKAADLLDAILEDFNPKGKEGVKFRMRDASAHEKLDDAAILLEWLSSKEGQRYDAIRRDLDL
jgi:hypothetical protein